MKMIPTRAREPSSNYTAHFSGPVLGFIAVSQCTSQIFMAISIFINFPANHDSIITNILTTLQTMHSTFINLGALVRAREPYSWIVTISILDVNAHLHRGVVGSVPELDVGVERAALGAQDHLDLLHGGRAVRPGAERATLDEDGRVRHLTRPHDAAWGSHGNLLSCV